MFVFFLFITLSAQHDMVDLMWGSIARSIGGSWYTCFNGLDYRACRDNIAYTLLFEYAGDFHLRFKTGDDDTNNYLYVKLIDVDGIACGHFLFSNHRGLNKQTYVSLAVYSS